MRQCASVVGMRRTTLANEAAAIEQHGEPSAPAKPGAAGAGAGVSALALARAHVAQAKARRRFQDRSRRLAGRANPLTAHSTSIDIIGTVHQSPTQKRGAHYETLALAFLEKNGLTLLARNLRLRCGELDLLMCDDNCLVIVEVRARASDRYGGAAASVTCHKQRRLAHCAAVLLPGLWRRALLAMPRLRTHRLARHQGLPPCRFDIIAFEAGRLNWLQHAFELS